MSDVIDFNDLRNKITQKDEEDFKEFIFKLYDRISNGEVLVCDIGKKMDEYSDEKGFSREKMTKLREELVRDLTIEAGLNLDIIEDKIGALDLPLNMADFEEISIKSVQKYVIFNEKNNMQVIIEGGSAFLISENRPDFTDMELNEIINEYKSSANLSEIQLVYMKEMERYIL